MAFVQDPSKLAAAGHTLAVSQQAAHRQAVLSDSRDARTPSSGHTRVALAAAERIARLPEQRNPAGQVSADAL